MQSKIKKEISKMDSEFKQIDKKQSLIANGRLVMAIFFVVGVALKWKEHLNLGLVVALVSLVGFIYLVRLDAKNDEDIRYIEARKTVLQKYLARFNDDWREFSDDGRDLLRKNYTQAIDLDLFGKNSVFQYISVAHTVHGRRALAKALEGAYLSEADSRTIAVEEIIAREKFAWDLESVAILSTKGKVSKSVYMGNFLRLVKTKANDIASVKMLAYVLPIFTFLSLGFAFAHRVSFMFPLAFIGIQLVLNMAVSGSVKEKMDLFYEMNKPLNAYSNLADVILGNEFKSEYLKNQQERLKSGGGAKVGLKALSKVLAMLEVQNSLLYLPLCGLFMWNYQCLLRFNNWCDKYNKNIEIWLEAIGEIESLTSLAMLGFVKEDYCVAQIVDSDIPFVEVQNAKHPLLSEEVAIANSFTQKSGLCVITGSNMSGKTTFMRTLGVNLVLAYAGGVVNAQSFRVAKMQVLTSMRIIDDVSEGISTFYGELLRVKSMVSVSEEKVPMIAMIDEIFKGTNSADRIIGAKATLKALSKPWSLVMVTTHDFELCDLANEVDGGSNYHFSEYYDEGKLKFDYLIKNDRCTTSNAKELMHLVGLM